MMYQNKLVGVIKANGKILRENKENIFMPFGQEYSILLKNLNSVRAQVRVEIDGQDATENVSLVIQPNSEIELKRFIKNGNMTEGNAFKFIERTGSIEQHRGTKIDDGLIRIEFQFEKPYVAPQVYYNNYYNNGMLRGSGIDCSAGGAGITTNSSYASASSTSVTQTSNAAVAETNEVGITVPGSKVEQTFTQAAWFQVEAEKHVMIMHLLGETENGTPVIQPVTVQAKPKCITCGKVNKANAKFCNSCGTSLIII